MWKRWKHCWLYYVDDKKVGVVSCHADHKKNRIFDAYVKGHRLVNIAPEYRESCTVEGMFTRLTEAQIAIVDVYNYKFN